jgi:hypothetical protein
MKKYLFKILLFFVAVAVIDFIFGLACQYMNDHSRGGGVMSRHYVCKESAEEVLIFGSSRAKHHYVPDVIEDSLGMTCYNTGEDGNGIILSYGFLKMITERYHPRLVLYDVSAFDVLEDDNMKYLDLMKPYYYECGIDSIFWAIDPKTRLTMHSNLYRYNTSWIRVLGSYFLPVTNYPKGYLALHKTMSYEPNLIDKNRGKKVDVLKVSYFEKFIKLAQKNGITLICCVSPTYKPEFTDYTFTIQKLCEANGVAFLNYRDIVDISHNRNYFQDRTHMNDEGARKFTSFLIHKVLEILNNSQSEQ